VQDVGGTVVSSFQIVEIKQLLQVCWNPNWSNVMALVFSQCGVEVCSPTFTNLIVRESTKRREPLPGKQCNRLLVEELRPVHHRR